MSVLSFTTHTAITTHITQVYTCDGNCMRAANNTAKESKSERFDHGGLVGFFCVVVVHQHNGLTTNRSTAFEIDSGGEMLPFTINILSALVIIIAAIIAVLIYPRRRQILFMVGLVTELLPPAAYGPAWSLNDVEAGGRATGRRGRWAIVTGASRGIGRGFVRALARDGWCLICLDLDDSKLRETVAEAAASGILKYIYIYIIYA